jgi:hypothetical protein
MNLEQILLALTILSRDASDYLKRNKKDHTLKKQFHGAKKGLIRCLVKTFPYTCTLIEQRHPTMHENIKTCELNGETYQMIKENYIHCGSPRLIIDNVPYVLRPVLPVMQLLKFTFTIQGKEYTIRTPRHSYNFDYKLTSTEVEQLNTLVDVEREPMINNPSVVNGLTRILSSINSYVNNPGHNQPDTLKKIEEFITMFSPAPILEEIKAGLS